MIYIAFPNGGDWVAEPKKDPVKNEKSRENFARKRKAEKTRLSQAKEAKTLQKEEEGKIKKAAEKIESKKIDISKKKTTIKKKPLTTKKK